MPNRLLDPTLDVVRSGFLDSLSRFCLLLALGNFLAILPLYWLYAYDPSTNELFAHYSTLLTVVGVTLTVLGILCRYQNMASVVAKLCVAILFAQTCYLLVEVQTLQHPVVMLFPILCFVSTPILGLPSTYGIAVASIVALSALNFVFFKDGWETSHLAGLGLISLAIAFCAHASFLLWRGVLRREKNLKQAVSDLEAKSKQIDAWVNQLVDSSRMITQGQFSEKLPDAPPTDVLDKLSANIGQMQKTLGNYFAELMLKDRLDSIGLLASGLAHEINTPLTTMKFILESNREQLPAATANSLTEEIVRMGKITREFLTFASPHQDGEVVDLNDLVQMSVSLLSKIPKGSPTIVAELCEESLPVEAIKNQLEQVLLNLYRNSADSMKGMSRPTFTIRTEKLNEAEATLTLEDNGRGISPDALPRIFDPFFSTKPAGEGFGLGLYICQHIVHRHKGSIEVRSKPDQGTMVTVRLPLRVSKEERKAA